MSLNRRDKREVDTLRVVAVVVALLPLGSLLILAIPSVRSNLGTILTILFWLLIVFVGLSVILFAVGLVFRFVNQIRQNNPRDKREVDTLRVVAVVVALLPLGSLLILAIPSVRSNLGTILLWLLIVLVSLSVILFAVGLVIRASNRIRQNTRPQEHERSAPPEREAPASERGKEQKQPESAECEEPVREQSGGEGGRAGEIAKRRTAETTEITDKPHKADLVPQGGGIKSTGLVGGSPEDRAFLAALRATAPLIPLVAVSTSTLIFLTIASGVFAFIVGFVATILIWLVLALFYRPYTSAASPSRRNYNLLRERLSHLQNRLRYDHPEGYGPQDEPEDSIYGIMRQRAHAYAQAQCTEIEKALKSRGMPWVTGLGYVELWHRVHRAEEALIRVGPYPEALEGAIRDESRLIDSTIDNKSSLLRRLYRAIAVLDDSMTGDALNYFKGQEEHPSWKEEQATPESRAEALAILSEVRYEVNNFRDNSWEGFVNLRNRLADTVVLLGLTTYALLALAIFLEAPPETIIWAVTYFLIGAIAGLFARAQSEWGAETAVDDFGLSKTLLLQIPWLSGLAATGGVVIIGVFSNLISSHAGASSLTTIFDARPSLLIIAVVFGLIPDLIMRRLTLQVDRYKQDLQSTQIGKSTAGAQSIETEQQSR